MFDHLLLLRKGGQVVYHGELGNDSKKIIDYFEKHGARPCTPDENPYVAASLLRGGSAENKSSQCRLYIECHWRQFDIYLKPRLARDMGTLLRSSQATCPIGCHQIEQSSP